jgi:hypothetical protein
LIPQAKYFSTVVPFTPDDLEAFGRSMACHHTQYSDDVLQRILGLMKRIEKLEWPLSPWIPMPSGRDLFAD